MARTDFAGKTVLVTGASSGIGADLAREFAARGACVGLAARRVDRLKALASELSRAKKTLVCPADVADAGQCEALIARVEGELGSIDVLVNNAGLGDLGPFQLSEPAAIQRMIDVNVTALTRLTRLVAPGMVQRGRGWILNVASTGGFTPMPLMSVYGATKAYVINFSEALHVELGRHGIRVCCLCPGTTKSEFFERGGFERHKERILGMAADSAGVARMGINALGRGRMTRICGVISAVQTHILNRLLPRAWQAKIVGAVLRSLRG